MEGSIDSVFKSFFSNPRNMTGLMFLRIGLSLALLGKIVNQMSFWEFTFTMMGPNYLINKGYFYNFFFTDWGLYLYFGFSLFGVIFFLADKFFYIGAVLLCFSYLISSEVVPVGHGGDAFARFLYVYLLLTIPNIRGKLGKQYSKTRVFIHNIGIISLN